MLINHKCLLEAQLAATTAVTKPNFNERSTSTKDQSFNYSKLVAVVAAVTKPNINERSTSTKDQSFIHSKLVACLLRWQY